MFTDKNLGECKQGLECNYETGVTVGHGICTKVPQVGNVGGVMNGGGYGSGSGNGAYGIGGTGGNEMGGGYGTELEGGAHGIRGGSELGIITLHWVTIRGNKVSK